MVSYSIYENATSEVSRVFAVERKSSQSRLKGDGQGLENQVSLSRGSDQTYNR